MKEFKLLTDRVSTEWTVYQCDTFSVTVKSWKSKNYEYQTKGYGSEFQHHWNVYGHVFDTHELYKTPELTKELPFHGGCTFDQHKTHQPIGGIRYDWQQVTNTLTVGSDYSHLYDHFEDFDPKEGIPHSILEDAEELVNALLNWSSIEQ
jgi:hypothetical protein